MKSPIKANQTKNLAAALINLKALVSTWNREPSEQKDDRIVRNSLYSGKKKRRQNTGPEPFYK